MLPKQKVRILSVDPGGDMGISISEFDTLTGQLTVERMLTLEVDKGIRYDSETVKLRFTKFERRARYIDPILSALLEQYEIDVAIYEASYFASSLTAYSSLLFYGNLIRDCAKRYDWDMLIQSVSPSRVKSLLEVDGRSGDKDLMRKAIQNHPCIDVDEELLLTSTEHAVDAVGIAHVVVYEFNEQRNKR